MNKNKSINTFEKTTYITIIKKIKILKYILY